MPAVEGLQQERRALSPERDLALPFSRGGGELRGRSHTWRLCTSPYSCSVSPGPRPLSQMRRSWAQTYAVLHYHGATRGKARSKCAYVPLPTWWPRTGGERGAGLPCVSCISKGTVA